MIETKDPQQSAVYDNEQKICEETADEFLPLEAAEAAAEAVWKRQVDLPVPKPNFRFDACEHVYDPWKHQVKLAGRRAPVTKLLHELAHAKVGAIGIGPLIESHGPIFCRVFGKMWSQYTTIGFETFRDRAESFDISIANRMPDLSGASWALVEDPEGLYALRPAERAVEVGLNIRKTFTIHVRDHHPMA